MKEEEQERREEWGEEEERMLKRSASSLAACVWNTTRDYYIPAHDPSIPFAFRWWRCVQRPVQRPENESPTIRRTDQFQWDATVKGKQRRLATLYFATDIARIIPVETLILGVLREHHVRSLRLLRGEEQCELRASSEV